MKIEVGEYVRIKEKGIIGKIEQIGVSLFWLEDGSAFNIKEKLYKHSKNIIDLIEVGDLVEVPKAYGEKGTILYHMIDKQYTESFTRNLKVEYIKTILTKEQYSQNCFRLEE